MDMLPVRLDTLITDIRDAHIGGDPLDRVGAALATATDLADAADHLVDHFVDEARALGYSWTQIGERIGVTKQAVRKRFAAPEVPPEPSSGAAKIFGRYDAVARRAVLSAEEAARSYRHAYIGTEHLLLGICAAEDGLAVPLLRRLTDDDITAIRLRVVERIGSGPDDTAIPGHIPFTPKAKRVLELTTRQAFLLGHAVVGTGHILLGILAESTGIPAQILHDAGVTEPAAQEELGRLLAEHKDRARTELGATSPPTGTDNRSSTRG